MLKQDLIKEFYGNKNFEHLKEILHGTEAPLEKEYLARIYLEEKNYKEASILYKETGMLYEFGRCELLCGNLENTKEIWSKIKEDTSLVLWGKSLLEFINLYVINVPTFFQIRAFLEVDFDALLQAGLITYCENIANGAHLFAQNNQESYKFIGRVFINNGYYDLADLFLQKAKELCYVDPEVHMMLAKCYLQKNDMNKAKQSLKTSLEKGYGYYPARKMLEELENNQYK